MVLRKKKKVIFEHDECSSCKVCEIITRELTLDVNQIVLDVNNKLKRIEEMIQSHSIGVQNVYNEVNQVKEKLSLPELEEKLVSIGEFKKSLKKTKEYIGSKEFKYIYDKIDSFRDDVEEMLEFYSRKMNRDNE